MRLHPVRSPADERGTAIILALFFLILSIGIIYTGALNTETLRRETDTQFRSRAQATQFARSGLVEAISWFRRQSSQPVTGFDPRLDPVASPPLMDTDEPEIGLVREFRIGGRLWGRYEVWKTWPTDPDPLRAGMRQDLQTTDVSHERTGAIDGTAWRMRSVGYVFERADDNVAYDQNPNRVASRQVIEGEVLRLRLSPPGAAAINLRDGGFATVGSHVEVDGGANGAGVLALQNTGAPTVSGTLSGQPGFLATADYVCSVQTVFGCSERDLVTASDLLVQQVTDIPVPLPGNSLVVIDAGPVTFDASRPLRGTAVVYVRGDVTIAAGSTSSFSGMLYVDGNLRIAAPADIAGSIVVSDGHRVDLSAVGDWVHVNFDPDVLESLRREIGQYRLLGAMRPVGS